MTEQITIKFHRQWLPPCVMMIPLAIIGFLATQSIAQGLLVLALGCTWFRFGIWLADTRFGGFTRPVQLTEDGISQSWPRWIPWGREAACKWDDVTADKVVTCLWQFNVYPRGFSLLDFTAPKISFPCAFFIKNREEVMTFLGDHRLDTHPFTRKLFKEGIQQPPAECLLRRNKKVKACDAGRPGAPRL